MQTQVPASQQVQALTQQLTQLLVQKEDALARVKEAETSIAAIRNVLAGVNLGQQLAAEQASAAPVPGAEQSN